MEVKTVKTALGEWTVVASGIESEVDLALACDQLYHAGANIVVRNDEPFRTGGRYCARGFGFDSKPHAETAAARVEYALYRDGDLADLD